jgi:hypothetical protein
MPNQEQLQQTPIPPKKKRSRIFRTLLYLFLACVLLITLTIILIPYALSSNKSREWMRKEMEKELGVPVVLEKIDFSWGKGITLEGLSIQQPKGFGEGEAISLNKAHADISLKALTGLKFDFEVLIEDPKIQLVINEQGKSNFETLFPQTPRDKKNGAFVFKSTPDEMTKSKKISFSLFPRDARENLEKLKAQISIRRGEIRIEDRQAGLIRTLSGLEFRVGNGGFGDPLRVSLETKILNEKGESVGSIGMTGEAPILPDLPIQFTMRNSNFDLRSLKGTLDSLLGSPFSAFEGNLDGNLGVYLHQKDGKLVKISLNGDLTIKDLKVQDGPLGKGKGIVIPKGSIRPRVEIDPSGNSLSVEGTMANLGFLQVRSLPDAAARALLDREKDLGAALGLLIEIDLKLLGQQPGLLPKGVWEGKTQTKLATFLEQGWMDKKRIPIALEIKGEQLEIKSPFLPKDFEAPKNFFVEGSSNYQIGAPKNNAVLRISSQGLKLTSESSLTNSGKIQSHIEANFDTERSKALWRPFVPKGMSLQGLGRFVADLNGMLEEGLLDSLGMKAQLTAPRLSYLGNDLENFRQNIDLKDGILTLQPEKVAKLNGGKLNFSASAPLASEGKPLSFKFGWLGGKAGGGVIPILRYAFPLLAGIPIDDVTKIAGVDFSSIASIQLEGSGPIPKDSMALNRWSGKGSIHLSKGGFRPSKQLEGLLKLLGQKSKITFDDAVAKFEIKDGKLATHDLRVGGKDGIILLKGWTSLAGTLNYKIDLTDIFKKSKRGRQILKARGNTPVQIQMTGSLTSPTLQAEDFVKKFLQNGLENAAKGFLRGLGQGKSPGRSLRDLLKGLKRK